MSPHYAIGTSMASVLAVAVGAAIGYSDRKDVEPDSNEPLNVKSERSAMAFPSTPTDADSTMASSKDSEVIFGTSIPRRIGSVDILACVGIVSTALLFSPLGARMSKRVQANTIKLAQGGLLMCVAPSILARDFLVKSQNAPAAPAEGPFARSPSSSSFVSEVMRFAGIGVFSGFTAGFFGVGGGAIVVPALVWLTGADYRTALGTSMAGTICYALFYIYNAVFVFSLLESTLDHSSCHGCT
jgi:hypothetical protein